MKTLELEQIGLTSLTTSEMTALEGGILVGLFNLLSEAAKLVLTEAADFTQGVKDGFNSVVK